MKLYPYLMEDGRDILVLECGQDSMSLSPCMGLLEFAYSKSGDCFIIEPKPIWSLVWDMDPSTTAFPPRAMKSLARLQDAFCRLGLATKEFTLATEPFYSGKTFDGILALVGSKHRLSASQTLSQDVGRTSGQSQHETIQVRIIPLLTADEIRELHYANAS